MPQEEKVEDQTAAPAAAEVLARQRAAMVQEVRRREGTGTAALKEKVEEGAERPKLPQEAVDRTRRSAPETAEMIEPRQAEERAGTRRRNRMAAAGKGDAPPPKPLQCQTVLPPPQPRLPRREVDCATCVEGWQSGIADTVMANYARKMQTPASMVTGKVGWDAVKQSRAAGRSAGTVCVKEDRGERERCRKEETQKYIYRVAHTKALAWPCSAVHRYSRPRKYSKATKAQPWEAMEL